MTLVSLKCPFCQSPKVRKDGIKNGKQRYRCKNTDCSHQIFYEKYTYKAYKPEVKSAIIKQSINGSGVRVIARHLDISKDTVMAELKKEKSLTYVNEKYIQSHKHCKIKVEMDKMWSYYHDKSHQIWLGQAIDHETSEVIAYWFGTREHGTLDKLLELFLPLDLGKIYVDGNDAYDERFGAEQLVVSKANTQKIERKHLSLRTWCSHLVRKDIRFSKSERMHKICVGLVSISGSSDIIG